MNTEKQHATRVATLVTDGWSMVPDDGFIGLVGPFWERQSESGLVYGFLAEAKHKNRSGVVQGGMLATLADRSLGRTARADEPSRRQATVQLDIQYIDAAKIGEFITAHCRVLRQTSTLVFLAGTLEAEGRLVANVTGIWKIKRPA